MDARRVNLSGGSTTTNENAKPNTTRNPGQAQAVKVGAGMPQVDMGAMYQFSVNMMHAGAVAELVGGNQESPVINNYVVLSRDYTRLGGKLFIRTEGAIEVENWLLYCERIFADLGLNDEQKRRLASKQLQGAALYWWNSVTVEVNEETMTWVVFKRRFEEKFMSEIAKSTLLRKFGELEQGDMIVLEYATRFEELSRYGYTTVDTVIKRNEKFIRGLKPELALATLSHIRDPCDVVVEMALRQEEMLDSNL